MNKNLLNVGQIFEHFITFAGDADKTAVALNLDPQDVRQLAIAERWHESVERWNQVRQGDSRDVQIQINRAINYVQAHRMRSVLDKLVNELSGKDSAEIIELLTTNNAHGSTFNTRALTDLVKGLEACQAMTARALGDTADERPDESKTRRGSTIALQVMAAMGAADKLGIASVDVVKQQLSNASTASPAGADSGHAGPSS